MSILFYKILKYNYRVIKGTALLQASIGIAELLALAMQDEGLGKEEAYSKLWMVDSRGLLVKVIFKISSVITCDHSFCLNDWKSPSNGKVCFLSIHLNCIAYHKAFIQTHFIKITQKDSHRVLKALLPAVSVTTQQTLTTNFHILTAGIHTLKN